MERFEPPMRCVAQHAHSVVAVSRTPAAAFLYVDGDNTTVRYDTTSAASAEPTPLLQLSSAQCVDMPVRGHDLKLCQRAEFLLPVDRDVLESEAATVLANHEHINGDASTCQTDATDTLLLVPAPRVARVEPAALCRLDTAAQLLVTGEYMLRHKRAATEEFSLALFTV